MRQNLFFLFFLGTLVGAHAQPVAFPTVEVVSGVIDSRSRIEAERLSAGVEFDSQVARCYGRFAVNDCIAQSRTKQRATLDALRHRELAINKAAREKKVQAQLARIRANAPDRQDD